MNNSLSLDVVRIAVITCSLLVCQAVTALDPSRSYQNLTPLTQYFADKSGLLTFTDIEALPDSAWSQADSSNFNFGFSDIPYWFRMNISNSTQADQSLLLEIGRSRIDRVELFVQQGSNLLKAEAGKRLTMVKGSIEHRKPTFPIMLEAGQSADIIIRAQSAETLAFPINLWHEDRFFRAERNNMLFFGLYFGVWLLVLVINTVLYSAINHRALASFIALVFSFGIYELTTLGLGSTISLAQYPYVYDILTVISMACVILSLMFFAQNLLNLEQDNPIGLKILRLIAYPAVFCLLIYPLLGYATVMMVLTAMAGPSAFLVLLLGINSALQGNRLGIYASIAWTPLLLGIMLRTLVRFEQIPMNFITENAAPAGFMLMMSTLSFFIAAEYRRQRQSNRSSADLEFDLGEHGNARPEMKEHIEELVHDRTQELESALLELSQANETLKEINTMDTVTGIKNRHYFDTIFEQEWKRASRQNYPISLLLLDIDHFKQVNDTLGHLAGDECLHEVAATISAALKRPADIVARYGGEEFVAVLPYIENSNALAFANKIRSRVEAAVYLIDGQEVKVTVSIGVSTVTPTDDDDMKDMIAAADIALYEAKNAGRNQVRNAGQLTVHTGSVAS